LHIYYNFLKISVVRCTYEIRSHCWDGSKCWKRNNR